MKTTTELEIENAHLRAELDAALALKKDVGELTDFISNTYPERAGQKSTRTAIEEITRLRSENKTLRETVADYAEQWVDEHV